ncbi:DgyrCDS12014 [Dimorphilus gyrociliatus]|uniref:DgyrCDS12014 n=1 Tax=Dimorphilus gyrociliatus TaxID=2664684 RepID=A0A7I8W8F7_9ANNE|nr:DgyrCDS12014 [Dimorphilus gyrociliatus]
MEGKEIKSNDGLKRSYFETKTRMLEIIQESLRVKLEVNLIKEAFLNVLHTQNKFEKETRLSGHQSDTMEMETMSPSRAKVRATYDSRRTRLRTKRKSQKLDEAEKENISPPSKLHRSCRCSKKQLTSISEDFSFMPKAKEQLREPTDGAQTSVWTNSSNFDPDTPPSIQDISLISKTSANLRHERTSNSNLFFDGTFNYPLHSTLNYPLHSTLNSDQFDDIIDTIDKPKTEGGEDEFVDSVKTLDKAAIRSDSFKSSTSTSRSSNSRSGSKKLCKEHGLHPKFGGPCIFNKASPASSKKIGLVATDYDSSYLSECSDEDDLNDDDNINLPLRIYDPLKARMRILKRQTGQTSLARPKEALGLQESNLFESPDKAHLSTNATCASEVNGNDPTAPDNSPNSDECLPSAFQPVPHSKRRALQVDRTNSNFHRIKRDERGQFRVPEIPIPISKKISTKNVREDNDFIYFYDKKGRPKTVLRQTKESNTKLTKRRRREIKRKLEQFSSNFYGSQVPDGCSDSSLSDTSSIKILGQL